MRSALNRLCPLSIVALALLFFSFIAIAQTEKTDQKKNPSQSETQTADQQSLSRWRNPNPPRRRDDNISVLLDSLYHTADQYLKDLALKSGGEFYRADTLGSLPDVFANIAAELRNQYSLGYYPANQARDGKYRKIQIKVLRKDVVVRARPGYRAPGANSK